MTDKVLTSQILREAIEKLKEASTEHRFISMRELHERSKLNAPLIKIAEEAMDVPDNRK